MTKLPTTLNPITLPSFLMVGAVLLFSHQFTSAQSCGNGYGGGGYGGGGYGGGHSGGYYQGGGGYYSGNGGGDYYHGGNYGREYSGNFEGGAGYCPSPGYCERTGTQTTNGEKAGVSKKVDGSNLSLIQKVEMLWEKVFGSEATEAVKGNANSVPVAEGGSPSKPEKVQQASGKAPQSPVQDAATDTESGKGSGSKVQSGNQNGAAEAIEASKGGFSRI